MKQNIYVMIDSVSGNHGDLFMMPNDATVIRTMSSLLEKDKSNPLAINYFRDTQVFCIGTFDSSESPMIEPFSPSRFVLSGASLIVPELAADPVGRHEEDGVAV